MTATRFRSSSVERLVPAAFKRACIIMTMYFISMTQNMSSFVKATIANAVETGFKTIQNNRCDRQNMASIIVCHPTIINDTRNAADCGLEWTNCLSINRV
eukprot:950132_1